MKNFNFTKAEALSNDFVIIDDRENGEMSFSTDEVVMICDRRYGIGADGILLLQSSSVGDFLMRTLNSDGSEAEMCGNGIRCAAKYAYIDGGRRQKSYAIETLAGIKNIEIKDDSSGNAETIRVDLGEPVILQLEQRIDAGGRTIDFANISMGNPHAVIMVDDVTAAEVNIIGPAVEHHNVFPNKTNVEFIRIHSPNLIEMRVWERGAGETAACGTGAAAALTAAQAKGMAEKKAIIKLVGGDLLVEIGDNGHIYITGGANMVFTGSFRGA